MNISICYKDKPQNLNVKSKIEKLALKYGHTINDLDPDVVFFVGGDGTFLRAVQEHIDDINNVKFVGVNKGNLGFFYDYSEDNLEDIFLGLKNQTLQEREYSLLKADVVYENNVDTYYAVNEIRIENPFHTLISNVSIDNMYFETFKGNGLIVSSTLGSTAYSRSVGGAIIAESLEVMQLTEIAPINNKVSHSLSSALIIDGNKNIAFDGDFSKVLIGYDHLSLDGTDVKKVLITLSEDKKIHILCSPEYKHLEKIRKSFIE